MLMGKVNARPIHYQRVQARQQQHLPALPKYGEFTELLASCYLYLAVAVIIMNVSFCYLICFFYLVATVMHSTSARMCCWLAATLLATGWLL